MQLSRALSIVLVLSLGCRRRGEAIKPVEEAGVAVVDAKPDVLEASVAVVPAPPTIPTVGEIDRPIELVRGKL